MPESQNQEQGISKARQFADTALSVETDCSAREMQEKLAQMQARHSARGMLRSGATVLETVKIHGDRITALLRSRMALLLEGFAMYDVTIDDNLMERVIRELGELRLTWINNARSAFAMDPVMSGRLVPEGSYMETLERNVGMSANEIRTQIERSRQMPKKPEGNIINVYHVQGSNNRWLTNSQDHSVNVVMQSSDQIFSNLRQEIEAKVPAGEEKLDILGKLSALQKAENTPSFKQRYTEFIAAAANHMVLLTPFIPALTEMLQKVL